MRYFIIYTAFILFSFSLLGQNALQLSDGRGSPPATIDDVSWIAGHWKGQAFGGDTEEIWTPPTAGTMMGAFKLSHGKEVDFYELCIIREVENTLLLQLKHFHKDLKGWETKDETVDFPLVKIEKHKVFFESFTFERVSEDQLNLYVVIDNDNDESEEVTFVYHKVDNQNN